MVQYEQRGFHVRGHVRFVCTVWASPNHMVLLTVGDSNG